MTGSNKGGLDPFASLQLANRLKMETKHLIYAFISPITAAFREAKQSIF